MSTAAAAPWWLPGGHLQTVYAQWRGAGCSVAYRRERIDTPDGDFLDLDWVDGDLQEPLLVLFHGLEGCSRSRYALLLMHVLRQRGRRGVVVHFRGCSGEPNRLPRGYHSGDSAEIDYVLRRLRAAERIPLLAVGVSLGGNALLKWLGEQQAAATAVTQAAAAISAPLDLPAAGAQLSRSIGLAYAAYFLRSLKPKALSKLARFPSLYSAQDVLSARSMFDFDERVTAPLHGFKGALDYWTRASCKPWLRTIQVPTLVLNARNDPFLPAARLPTAEEVAGTVCLQYLPAGGHVGFTHGPFPGSSEWLPRRILEYFDSLADRR